MRVDDEEEKQVPHLMVALNVGGVVGNSIRDSEVNQLELSSDEHKIGRLQVRMDDLLLVNNMNCL